MKQKIPYGLHFLDDEDIQAVVEVLQKGPITQGSVVREFGEALSDYSGARYCVPVSSGTAALHLSLAALDIGPGDEVITTPLTFCATANVVLSGDASAGYKYALTLPDDLEEGIKLIGIGAAAGCAVGAYFT